MTEEENASVESPAEEAQQEVAHPAETENVQKSQEETQEKKARDDQAYNWAEARRKMQELERQNRELSDRVGRIKDPEAPKEEEPSLAEDDLPTYGHVKKFHSKREKELEKRIEQRVEQKVRAELASTTLKLRYPDYDAIVTNENIELLKQQKPELALSLAHNPDPYAQAVAVYDALKMMGIGVVQKSSADKEKALKNAQKPLSVNAVAKSSAIGQAHMFENGLTPELKSQLWKEMQDCAKRA